MASHVSDCEIYSPFPVVPLKIFSNTYLSAAVPVAKSGATSILSGITPPNPTWLEELVVGVFVEGSIVTITRIPS